MIKGLEHSYLGAVDLLQRLTTTQGILASTLEADNYKRVWARDSIICGIAGLLANDDAIVNGLKQSLLTLAKYQADTGAIPSNVLETESAADVSHGSLVGRVDANTWFVIGACLYTLNTRDDDFWQTLRPKVESCRRYLKALELNGKGWLYTPLSGNWADEYPVQGYTLYDNMLRLWGESLFLKITNGNSDVLKQLMAKTRFNFWPKSSSIQGQPYHIKGYEEAASVSHFCSQILPGHYDMRFDASANAFALLQFKLSSNEKEQLQKYVHDIGIQLSQTLVPAFWPVITKNDWQWQLLQQNYSFDFKNQPHYFHNGGVWPVWMGWFCLGLAANEMHDMVAKITEAMLVFTQKEGWDFQEYINTENFELNGKKQMGFTASGIVFMYHAMEDSSFIKKLYL